MWRLQCWEVTYVWLSTRFMDEARISPFSDDAVIKAIPLSAFPPYLYMVVRTLMLLRGLCFSLDLDIQVITHFWLPILTHMMAETHGSIHFWEVLAGCTALAAIC